LPESSTSARPIPHARSCYRTVALIARLALVAGITSVGASGRADAATAYALTTANEILVFDTGAPGTIVTTVTPTGLQAGEAIVAIDVRPATGQLYALGGSSRLYVLDVPNPLPTPTPATISVTAVQVGTAAFSPMLNGARFGFDFNPTVDRIRVVSDSEQNLRLNPDTGALAGADTSLTTTGDVVASAYTNNFSGATATTLFGIDAANDQLVLQAPPNDGVITPVGALGVDTSTDVGFDITANDGIAFAALTVGGASSLYTINLTTGVATVVGQIGPAPVAVRGLAVLSRALTLYGVTTTNQLVRFSSVLPGTIINAKAITGLQTGENVLGIDFRPANGRLYALGSSSRLYVIDTATARVTQVGTAPFSTLLSGTEFGFDFNPTVDRIRVVSDAGQNLRLNPDTAAIAGTDSTLTGGVLVGSAYTNNVDGATLTTLYGIDVTAAADRLVLQGGVNGTPSPNGGVLTPVGPLGFDSNGFVGFDISPLDGTAFAALNVAGTSNLYTVNLATGAAVLIGAIGGTGPIRAMAGQPTNFNFAEGSTGSFFDTDLLLVNPNDKVTPATITYLRDDGATFTQGLTLQPNTRTTVTVDSVPGMEATAFSSVVSSPLGLPLGVERTMRWDPTGYGSHTERAADALARTWYFAEGAQGFFDTFLLLSNPGPKPTTASVEFLIEGGGTVTKSYAVNPRSRVTVWAGGIPELVNQSFAFTVTFTIAAAAERAMYFGQPTFNAGHESTGVNAASKNWFLAEGATGSFFTTFLLLANPGDAVATVTLNYFREGGGLVTKVKTLQPRSRLTINVALEDTSLAATAVATQVISDVPVVAERAQYWPFTPDQWYEAHNSLGATQTAQRWVLGEGRVGTAAQHQTFILLANPDPSQPANVTIVVIRSMGAPITKTFLVDPNARLTLTTGPGSMVSELANENFGAFIIADRPIFVERAFYSNANNVVFAAGSNATATAVP
jgi:hypothetical protein